MRLFLNPLLFCFGRVLPRSYLAALPTEFRDWRALLRRVDLLKIAHREGRENRPAASDVEPDHTQVSIINDFALWADRVCRAWKDQLEGALQLVIERQRQPIQPDFYQKEAALAVQDAREKNRESLIQARMNERAALRDLNVFKREHGLDRAARYPKARLLRASLIGAALVADALLNATLYTRAVPGGYQEGIMLAFIFSLVNVGLGAFLLGFIAMRHITHANKWKKVLARIFAPILAGAGVAWNLLIGHYRDVIAAIAARDVDTPASLGAAVEELIGHPFQLQSVEAFTLFAVGMIIFCFAVREGWLALDDPYAGYGTQDRLYRKIERAYLTAINFYKQTIVKALDALERHLGLLLEEDTRIASEVRDIAFELRQREREFRDSATALERECLRQLREYREEIYAVRTTPPPAYFAQYPAFAVALGDSSQVIEATERVLAAVGVNQLQAQDAKQHLRDALTSAIAELKQFIKEVEIEAERRVKAGLQVTQLLEAAQ